MNVGSFPKEFEYGAAEFDDEDGGAAHEQHPRILLMGLRRLVCRFRQE